MTFIFDDVTNPALLRRERRNRRILIGAVLSLLVGSLLTYWLWNWRQEAVAKRFLAALEQQDYREAYKLWKPSSSYRYQDFMRDWGPEGEYGKVERFEITGSRSRGSGVIVSVRVNGQETRIWVERKDKSMAFPPF